MKGEAAQRAEQEDRNDFRERSVIHTNRKRCASISKSVDNNIEPLSIDEGIDMSMEFCNVAAATNTAPNNVKALDPVIPDEIFPDDEIKVNFLEDTVKAISGSNIATTTKKPKGAAFWCKGCRFRMCRFPFRLQGVPFLLQRVCRLQRAACNWVLFLLYLYGGKRE